MKKQMWIVSVSLAMAMLMACSNNNAEAIEPQVSEVETSEVTEPQAGPATYGINKTSQGDNTDSENGNMGSESDSTGSEYEISDMLPRPSDDTFIMTVEEAEAFMNKNRN